MMFILGDLYLIGTIPPTLATLDFENNNRKQQINGQKIFDEACFLDYDLKAIPGKAIYCQDSSSSSTHNNIKSEKRLKCGETDLFSPVHLGSNAFKQAGMLLTMFAGRDGYNVEENNGRLMLGCHVSNNVKHLA
ncbi:hypothetical protein V6N12_010764 [Hibiscus sabdariffa]|uniref:Uncharacterized protein n=1 Tax=Hibiscus sabdariffa TaxID=183260 RepID=A0ABR2EL21_9ROSI